jgi:SOS response regulatory protein OraA/RecX
MKRKAKVETAGAPAFREKAIKFLARPVSAAQLKDHLTSKGAGERFIADFLKEAMDNKWIDDEALSAHLIEKYSEKNFGPLRITAELQRKGLAEELIEKAVAAALTEKSEEERCAAALARLTEKKAGSKATTGAKVEENNYKRNLLMKLLRLGFNSEIIAAKLDFW